MAEKQAFTFRKVIVCHPVHQEFIKYQFIKHTEFIKYQLLRHTKSLLNTSYQSTLSSSRRPLEPFLKEAPLCFSIMRKSASLDFRTLFYIQKIERVMLKHMDTSGKKVSNGRLLLLPR